MVVVDKDEAIVDACPVYRPRERAPRRSDTARVADSPPEKPEREDWISAAKLVSAFISGPDSVTDFGGGYTSFQIEIGY